MAGTAVALVLIIMLFISLNPWMLVGISAVLFAVASIVRAVNGANGPDRPDDHDDRRQAGDPPDDPEDHIDRGVPV